MYYHQPIKCFHVILANNLMSHHRFNSIFFFFLQWRTSSSSQGRFVTKSSSNQALRPKYLPVNSSSPATKPSEVRRPSGLSLNTDTVESRPSSKPILNPVCSHSVSSGTLGRWVLDRLQLHRISVVELRSERNVRGHKLPFGIAKC